jgi:hypothetical protein
LPTDLSRSWARADVNFRKTGFRLPERDGRVYLIDRQQGGIG